MLRAISLDSPLVHCQPVQDCRFGIQNSFPLFSRDLQIKSLEVSQTISLLTKFLQTKHAPQQVTCLNAFSCLQAYRFLKK